MARRWSLNITPAERIGRIVVGVAAIAAGIALLFQSPGLGVAVLEVLLILAGLDLAVTGALGHCPLYAALGYQPKSLKGAR
ncbi:MULTISPECIES: DUF2892 domain-containing protein [Rhodococcus]|uniref:YgaP family membrane protein n=1 Tax=Rhodococcus TaxID=1827 RepID=UPI000C9CAD2F|nr:MULTISPECIES: DUF2892 domain-containing protein [Rhodococcus]PND53280.1 DUF2892 domain-containing protein [Rhodococcus sp. ENV425]WKX01827.1 DUF2892 domain-containing protein [Rhodococcus aetherivorans]